MDKQKIECKIGFLKGQHLLKDKKGTPTRIRTLMITRGIRVRCSGASLKNKNKIN